MRVDQPAHQLFTISFPTEEFLWESHHTQSEKLHFLDSSYLDKVVWMRFEEGNWVTVVCTLFRFFPQLDINANVQDDLESHIL